MIIDRPGYLGAIQSFRAAGAKLIGWDVARADIDELEDLLVRYRPKLIYTNPTFQNPTGATMPIRTRRELLSLARALSRADRRGRDLSAICTSHDAPPPSLRELDEQNLVIHLNSFSKVMAPGLRLGWIVGGAVDRRSDRDHQAAARSAYAEPRPVRDGAADARRAASTRT